jgi:tRNA1Val (adenine37-N6)-methyltransferase
LCNPPFYLASQKSPDAARNRAIHATELPFEELLRFAQQFLATAGALHVLLPPHEAQLFSQIAPEFGLNLQLQLKVYTRPSGQHLRSILQFRQGPAPLLVPTEEICIREANNEYTQAFRQLLQPFYLIF